MIYAKGSITIGGKAVPGHDYAWKSQPQGFISSKNTPTVTPDANTVYILKEIISATGCSASDSALITVNPLPRASWFMTRAKNITSFHAYDSVGIPAYFWSFGDGGSDSVSGHLANHTYPKTGTYLINLKVRDKNGCVNAHDSSVDVTITGIKSEITDKLVFTIYPNPFQSTTTIQYNLLKSSQIKIALFDIAGRQVSELANKNKVPGEYQIEINADKCGLRPGMYLLKFMMGDEVVSKQLIKF